MGPFSTDSFSVSLQEENESIKLSALDTFEHPLLFVVLNATRSGITLSVAPQEVGFTEKSITALCSTPDAVVVAVAEHLQEAC
jgi:hypothetical protein